MLRNYKSPEGLMNSLHFQSVSSVLGVLLWAAVAVVGSRWLIGWLAYWAAGPSVFFRLFPISLSYKRHRGHHIHTKIHTMTIQFKAQKFWILAWLFSFGYTKSTRSTFRTGQAFRDYFYARFEWFLVQRFFSYLLLFSSFKEKPIGRTFTALQSGSFSLSGWRVVSVRVPKYFLFLFTFCFISFD